MKRPIGWSSLPVVLGDERGGERDHEADHDRDHGELQVLEERGLERVAPVVLHPAPAERVVLGLAGGARAEVGDDRALGEQVADS